MITLGVGDWGVSTQLGETIKTIGLGSCVAVMIADPGLRIAGMVHIALPDSNLGKDRSRELPGYFADTGIDILFEGMKKIGYPIHERKPTVKLAGGAAILDPNNTFNIGKRNILAIKRILWSKGLGSAAEDLGGTISRTVSIDVGGSDVKISSPGKESWIL